MGQDFADTPDKQPPSSKAKCRALEACGGDSMRALKPVIVRHPRRQRLTYINPHAFKRTSETTSDTAIEPTQPSRLEKNTNIAHLNYVETGLRAGYAAFATVSRGMLCPDTISIADIIWAVAV